MQFLPADPTKQFGPNVPFSLCFKIQRETFTTLHIHATNMKALYCAQ